VAPECARALCASVSGKGLGELGLLIPATSITPPRPRPHYGPSTRDAHRIMLSSIRHAVLTTIHRRIQRLLPPIMAPQLAVAGGISSNFDTHHRDDEADGNRLNEWIWFAVPKSRVSKSRKRMKTTAQKRIKLKQNIVIDKRTGELTLKHRLPLNWKNYLPENVGYAPKPNDSLQDK